MCTASTCDLCSIIEEVGNVAISDNGKAIIAVCPICGDIIYVWKAHDPCPCRDCTPMMQSDARQRFPGRIVDMNPSHGDGHFHFHVRKVAI